jgi:uncharacterized lipoprotein NlpE involved in copper resistance
MKKLFTSLSLAAFLLACQTKSTTEGGQDSTLTPPDETAAEAKALRPDTLNNPAAVSTSSSASTTPGEADLLRQYAGTYQGTFPCADCEGIETTLTLNQNGRYTIARTYKGKGDGKPSTTGGNWRALADGSRLELDFDKKDEITQFRAADERHLKLLGRDGQEIESKLNYTLTKQ